MTEQETRDTQATQIILNNVRTGDIISYAPHNLGDSTLHCVVDDGGYAIYLPRLPSGRDGLSAHYDITVINTITSPMHPFHVSVNVDNGLPMTINVERLEYEPTTAPDPDLPPDDLLDFDSDVPGHVYRYPHGVDFRVAGEWVGGFEFEVTISREMDAYQLLRKLEQMNITKKNKLALAELINKKVKIGTGKPNNDLETTKRKIRIDIDEKKKEN